MELIPDGRAQRDGPVPLGESFPGRQLQVGAELIPVIAEQVAEIVELWKGRDVADIAREVVLAGKAGMAPARGTS